MSCFYDVACPEGCTGTVDPSNPWSWSDKTSRYYPAHRRGISRTELKDLIRVTYGSQAANTYQAGTTWQRRWLKQED